MIISRTPYRISFFGGGTDYPAWYRFHGGEVLGAAITRYCYLTVRRLPPFFPHEFRVVYSKIENCASVHQIQHPSVREVLLYLSISKGLEIHHDGDLPARSGIGSSSSFTVGLLNAIHRLQGRTVEAHQLSAEAISIERDVLKETVGCQDQIFAAYGGLNHIHFEPEGNIEIEPVMMDSARLREFHAHLMLFYTGIQRPRGEISRHYVPGIRDQQCLHRIREIVLEAKKILLGQGSMLSFGGLLRESWEIKSSLSDKISNPEIDEMIRAARDAGANGGKILGAGGGGFLLLFAEPGVQAAIREKLSGLPEVPFRFDDQGSRIVFEDPSPASFCDLQDVSREYRIRENALME